MTRVTFADDHQGILALFEEMNEFIERFSTRCRFGRGWTPSYLSDEEQKRVRGERGQVYSIWLMAIELVTNSPGMSR